MVKFYILFKDKYANREIIFMGYKFKSNQITIVTDIQAMTKILERKDMIKLSEKKYKQIQKRISKESLKQKQIVIKKQQDYEKELKEQQTKHRAKIEKKRKYNISIRPQKNII